MADVTYANPFGLYQDQNPIPSNPFMSEWNAIQNRQTAQPFINQAKENGDLELMKRRMETGEFMSPEAQGARMSQFPLQQQMNESKGRMIQPEENAQRERLSQEIRALPDMTDQKIAQAQLAVQQAKGAPHRELLSELGQLYDTVKDASPADRPFLYQSALSRWQQTHPGSEVPEQFRAYREEFLPDLAAIRHAQIYSPDQVGKERLTSMQNQSAQSIAQGNNQTQVQVGAGHDAAHLAAVGAQVKAQETPPKAISRLVGELRKDPNNEGSKRELSYYLSTEFETKFAKDGRAQMLAISANGDTPQAQQAAQTLEQYKSWSRAQYYGEHNIDTPGSDMGFQEYQWAKANYDAPQNQGMSWDDVVAEGRKRGKIKSRAKK